MKHLIDFLYRRIGTFDKKALFRYYPVFSSCLCHADLHLLKFGPDSFAIFLTGGRPAVDGSAYIFKVLLLWTSDNINLSEVVLTSEEGTRYSFWSTCGCPILPFEPIGISLSHPSQIGAIWSFTIKTFCCANYLGTMEQLDKGFQLYSGIVNPDLVTRRFPYWRNGSPLSKQLSQFKEERLPVGDGQLWR